ncbi:pyridoxamine 5'-phosphate oxidase family protein [Rhodocyclus tenuis]|uniref:Pyridoxamine 5'-phosphate oxidase family protein n=2 Tax=Rhodocyclus TaxID=1064 RepID=A0A6L5JYE8_RHOTE|nr:pyridoxamine 5'-phosphate oxidase family protein [Rhodocyclus gracilis]MQY52355.1 pyridoxamine 5'-phosphate oxidase family protein [Rhodocyclus gracilis]NJA90117.1 pyridoxamine 5'-phosphate oxidase family protein [Rhodocyclus gracilis]
MQAATHPHGVMRRSDREITDRAEIDAILRSEKVMRIALVDGDTPFLVPVFFSYDGTALYFHSARSGSKIDIIKRNNKVCFEVSTGHGVIESQMACDFEARHKTVIGVGHIERVRDEAEKKRALDAIVARFTEQHFEYPEENFRATAVLRIDIDSLKGKKHGFA